MNSDLTAPPPASPLLQFFRYAIVGGIATVADLTVFAFLAQHLNYLLATTASFLAGTTVNFFLCLKFVFRLKGHSPTEALWRKFLASGLSLAVNLLAMFVMVDVLAFERMNFETFGSVDGLLLARILAIGLAFFINFMLTKYYAFRDY